MKNEAGLLKVIERCIRSTEPDLQSFVIEIDSGRCFVQAQRSSEVWIDVFSWDKDGNETNWQYKGKAEDVAYILCARGAKPETICM